MELINQLSQNAEKYLLECASLLVKFAHFKRAREIYSEILKKDLKHTEALKGLGICLYREKHWETAIKCFSAYVRFSGEIDGKIWLNSCYLLGGQVGIAEAFFEENLKNELVSNEVQAKLDSIPKDVLEPILNLREKAA